MNKSMPEWIAERRLLDIGQHGLHRYVGYIHSGNEVVAQVWNTGIDRGLSPTERNAETLANTNLIAAAREMQTALRTLVEHAQERYPHFESERGQLDIARAVLALIKSEGKS